MISKECADKTLIIFSYQYQSYFIVSKSYYNNIRHIFYKLLQFHKKKRVLNGHRVELK